MLQNTPRPPRDELGDQQEGTAGYLVGARGGYSSCVLICVGVFVNTGRIRIRKPLPPSTADIVRSLRFETGTSIDVYIFNQDTEICKKEKTRLKVHKNDISKCDFIAPIGRNIKTLKAEAFAHRMLIFFPDFF